MSKAFKPGDLAMVISAKNEGNIGKVVELLRVSSDFGISLPEVHPSAWAENSRGLNCWVFVGFVLIATSIQAGGSRPVAYGVLPEHCLMPLRDDDLPAETLDTAAPRELVSA
ncbi:KOW motif-containing protein [Pseudomonas sp.]|uniref:KOW motif-containing protein n=1 Tax=Pseudomonas sp. TaxID=306 RepID=UPI003FD7E2D4